MQFFTQKKFKTFTHFSWTFCKETSQICTFLILQHIDYSVNRWHFVLGGAVLNRSMFEISKVTKIYELKSVLCSFFYCFFLMQLIFAILELVAKKDATLFCWILKIFSRHLRADLYYLYFDLIDSVHYVVKRRITPWNLGKLYLRLKSFMFSIITILNWKAFEKNKHAWNS